jgi:hypothetical protein
MKECRGDHDYHICNLVKRNNDQIVTALAQRPVLKCRACGALADEPDSVCQPSLFHKRAYKSPSPFVAFSKEAL